MTGLSREESIPIINEGETIGSLNIRRDGLYTVFSGRCRDPGGLLRLSVYDDANREGYLGLMTPDKGALTLEKRLSRAAMAAFPENPDHAGPAGQENRADPPLAAAAENTQARPEDNPEQAEENLEAEKAPAEENLPGENVPEEEREPITYWRVTPNPWSLLGGMANKTALLSVKGALTAVEGERKLIALSPEEAQKLGDFRPEGPAGWRTIDGMDYVVYEIKDGKLS